MDSTMDGATIDSFESLGLAFKAKLLAIRQADTSVNWYPYDSMTNVQHLGDLVPAAVMSNLLDVRMNWRVLDVGAADGDLGYFFESRGCRIDFVENPATNANGCEGIRATGAALRSHSRLLIQDIDRRTFELPEQYKFAVALGLLYHLRNPMGFLIEMAEHAERMVLSTRVASHLPDGTSINGQSMAYLLFCRESNDDPTNYWTLSPLGLEVMLKRCGWNVVTKKFTGSEISNPVDQDADQRMFVYCERVPNWNELGKHHDF
jgi:tRNA (mo5U34)-methyltransferase